ncbi:MAG: glycosyltransferase family 4 protein [Candidatus Eisenbacteria bacterium]|nr:glycosyltransferase family 4 protein [Candidatus Eisenbacteria bacterium]
MNRKPRVAMHVEFLYPVVSQGRVPFAGGIEVQLTLMGRGLAKRGFDVHVVTCDYGQPDRLQADGLTLHKAYPPSGGIPVLRFFHPRLTLGLSALWRCDADVYLFRGAALWAGIVYRVARARGRRFVWLTGHDHDVMKELPDVLGARDRALVFAAIRGADAIVTQTQSQAARLKTDFGLDSTVIMNSVEIPGPERVVDPVHAGDVIWLSTYKASKRPDWFTRFAERHPQVRCRMAGVVPGPPVNDIQFRAARAVAARVPSLEVSGPVSREGIGAFLQGAAVFAHTSPSEGFPNTLLEAWAHGVSSVSCFDPDGIVEREHLGACRESYEEWEAAIEARLADPVLRAAESARARAWTVAHHAPEVVHESLARLLRSLL